MSDLLLEGITLGGFFIWSCVLIRDKECEMQLKDLESLSKWMLTYPSFVKPPLTWRIIHVRADTASWLLSECPDCSARRCCGCILTLSWLMSARKRLCLLYRSSFRGSCQYCACTRLITTKAASDQTIKKQKTKKDNLFCHRQTIQRY